MSGMTKEELLAKDELEISKVEFSNEKCVYVRQMTGHERDLFEALVLEKKIDEKGNVTYERTLNDFRAKLAVCTLCDEKGNLLLTKDEVSTLSNNMKASKLMKIVEAAQLLNRITEEDREKLIKNSEKVIEKEGISELPVISDTPTQTDGLNQ